MRRSTARVPTALASRYLQQLCKHWAHKFPVTFDPAHGVIDFGEAACTLEAEHQALLIQITATAAELDRWERVLANHVNRFAHREDELAFAWSRA